MRGHWLSGTRKLNRHYQSGGGAGQSSFALGEMIYGIIGFMYDRSGGEYYYIDNVNYERFYSDDSRNVIVAPLYSIFNTEPTLQSVGREHMIYASWWLNMSTYNWYISGRPSWNAELPVWKYGLIAGEPYWGYSYDASNNTDEVMQWYTSSESNLNINQNGKDRNGLGDIGWSRALYVKNAPSIVSQYSFSDVYGNDSFNVVIPVYEVVAIPDDGGLATADTKVVFTDNPQITIPSKTRLIGYDKTNIQRVPCRETGQFNSYIDSSDNVYVNYAMPADRVPRDYQYIYGGYDISELGAIRSNHTYLYPSDKIFEILVWNNKPAQISSDNPERISAGTYTDPDTGIMMNMIYAVRLDHLEVGTYSIGQRVINDTLFLGQFA
jgi:hypothetical protein